MGWVEEDDTSNVMTLATETLRGQWLDVPRDPADQTTALPGETLARAARLLASDLARADMFEGLHALLSEQMDAGHFYIVRCQESDGTGELLYPVQNPERLGRLNSRFDADPHTLIEIATRVAQRGQVLLFKSPSDAAQWRNDAKVPPAQPRDVTRLGVPLWHQGRVIGAMIVETINPESAFSSVGLELLQSLGMQVALVLERDRAREDARRRMDQLAAFSVVASTVNEWVDVEQLAHRFLGIILNTTGTQQGLFYLVQPHGELRLLAHFGLPPELVEGFKQGNLLLHPDVHRAMEAGQVAVLDDLARAAITEGARELARLVPVQAVAVLPLRVKGKPIGMVAVGKSEGQLEFADREFVLGLTNQAAQAIENARLFAELQRRADEQSILRELAQRFLSALNLNEILARTLETLTVLVPADFYEILLPEGDGNIFNLELGRGWRHGVIGRTRVVNDPHLHVGFVLRTQAPTTIDDFANEKRFNPADHLVRHQIVSGVCAPMLAETRAIGFIGVYSRSANQFSADQSHLVYHVATQTAIALEKARHSQAAARRLDELVFLNDAIAAANSQVSLDQVLKRVANEIGDLLRSEQVQLYFVNAAKRELTLAAQRERRPDSGARRLPKWGESPVGWAALYGEPLLIHDASRDVRVGTGARAAGSVVCAPMMIGARVIGVISVEHWATNEFDTNDLRLLTTLAGQIAATIERARLLDETQKRLAEITALFEFSNSLRSATDEARLHELVVSNAASILNALGGSLQLFSTDHETLKVVAVHNLPHLGKFVPRQIGGLSWEAFETGESYVVEDVKSDARVHMPEVLGDMHGAIIAPLRTPTGIIGTLFVGFEAIGAPSSDQLRLATTIANLAAHALQRLRLYEQTVHQASSLADALSDLEVSYQATLLALSAALDARDRETEGHSQRVTKLAQQIGKRMNLSEQELTMLERGALLHDVGKIGIPDNILLKPGPLSPEERALMRQHPQLGHDMLKGVPFLQEALPVVLYHQERYDGEGYPLGLRADAIPLVARIFAVADAYDAMTSTRPYRKALSHADAVAEIKRYSGSQFDPQVVEVFMELFQKEME